MSAHSSSVPSRDGGNREAARGPDGAGGAAREYAARDRRIDRSLPLRERLEAAVEILAARSRGVMGLLHARGIHGPPPEDEHHPGCGRPSPAALNDRFRAAVVDLVGPDTPEPCHRPDDTATEVHPC
jgi:hypothetical protein